MTSNRTIKKVVFFGTSDFAVPALNALVKEGYDIVAVITTPDEPTGRKQVLTPPPIKLKAQSEKLKVLQPERLKDNRALVLSLSALSPDVGIVASYGKIIPSEIINLFPKGILNIHPSLLPKYRGPSPIQYTLLNGDTETGVTILKVDEEVDHGPVIAYSVERIALSEKYEELHDKLAKLGAELLIKTLPDYLSGRIEPIEQDHSRATFTKKITKEDGRIDWHKKAKEIYNMYRAFHVWPGIFTSVKRKAKSVRHKAKSEKRQILEITDCRVSENQPYHGHDQIYIGVVYKENSMIYVPCKTGHIELLRVHLEGGKEMPIKEFLVGHRNFVGSLLE